MAKCKGNQEAEEEGRRGRQKKRETVRNKWRIVTVQTKETKDKGRNGAIKKGRIVRQRHEESWGR